MEDREYPFPDGVKLGLSLPHTMSLIPTVTHHSLFCVARPDRIEYLTAHGGGDLANRREYQVEAALKLGCTHIWLIDGDMDFPNDILIRLFGLLKQGADLAGGLCYRGYPPYDPIARHLTEKRNMAPYRDFHFGDIIEPKGTGTACLLVKSEVFEKVPRPWFSIIRDDKDPLKITQSLDMYFTERATELGFKLWIDTGEDVGHLKEIGINRDFYFMHQIFTRLTGKDGKTDRVHRLARKLSEPLWIDKLDTLLQGADETRQASPNKDSMTWQIISGDRSIFAQRLAGMLGLKIFSQPQGSFDGLFFVDMLPENMAISQEYRGTPKICYWTGSDARLFLNDGAGREFGPSIHVTDSPWLTIKLNSRIPNVCFLPMPPDIPKFDIPLEPNPGILMYLNQHPARDIKRSLSFIQSIHDIPIYVMRGPGIGVDILAQENVTDLKWIPSDDKREEIFKKISVYVRFMLYDGLSQTVIEMKMLGRHVFYTSNFPYCNYVDPKDGVDAVAKRVREVISLPLDKQAIKWYWSVFNRENFNKILGQLVKKEGWSFPQVTG
jgi:hypothetical protein